jgi:serine/threonine-protein kinase
VGKRFGKYTLLYRLAVGGMAEIFVAKQQGVQGFSRKIVLKRIRPHLSKEPSFVTMFLNEAKLAAQLNHSNICQIYDLGRIEESYFIAMEYVRGRDMRQILGRADKKGIPFPLEYALKVAGEVCEGLYHAHRKADEQGRALHIVHRDVTPENVMVSFDGEVKILDFGIAKAENTVSETRVGEIKGKLGYMSPEQVMGKILDQRSDVFSLGVILYEWLTGHKPFAGQNDVEVLKAVADGKVYPPTSFRPELPAEVEAIILKALARNREERYQNAWDLQFDINQFLGFHEFNPTNIHLSNFIRQLFAEDIAREDQALAQAEAEQDADPDRPQGEVTPAVAVGGERAGGPAEGKRSQTPRRQSSGVKRVTPGAPPGGEDPDPLEAELLASREGFMSVGLELERAAFERLTALAERNGLSLPALLREIVLQYTRFL